MRPDEQHETRPFLPVRRAYVDVLRAGRRKNLMHGLLEIDVTEARRRLRAEAAGLSFTAWVMHCLAAAVDADRVVQAYRRRSRLVLFEDVDVNTQVEVELAGQPAVKSVVVRAANRKSVEQLTAEIRRAQADDPAGERRYRGTRAFVAVPAVLRHLAWRVVLGRPELFKRFGGTVGLSSVGMFGSGGGWGIVMTPPTLMVVVGGISRQPRFVDGELAERELLSVTVSLDHDVVDGAPAARFAVRLTDLMQAAHGLPGGDPRPAGGPGGGQ